MRKTVLFLNGPSQDRCDRFFGWPTPLLYAISPSVLAMRDGTLAMEFLPEIFDPVWYVEGYNDEDIKRTFSEKVKQADIICASATYDALYPTLQLLREAKEISPNVVTILGGPHFDEVHRLSRFNDVQAEPANIDYGIAGDGEMALLALLKSLEHGPHKATNFNDVPGDATIYTRHGAFRTSGSRLPLNNLPFMPIELADQQRHRNDFDVFRNGREIVPTTQMIAQRGCGYHCSYCSERNELAYPNARSVENILQEVYLRKKQGFRAIFFDDSTFGLYPQLTTLLDELSLTGMKFGCLNRFNALLDHRILERYHKAGFIYFYCAIEQFDDNALALMQKAQDEKRILAAMELLHKYGFHIGVSLLYGLPYETDRSVTRTLDFTAEWVQRGTICLVSESILSLHPGTPAGQHLQGSLRRTPPNRGYPFDRFEEGQWYHHPHVTPEYLEKILMRSEARFRHAMVRNRHSWYAQRGYVERLHSRL